MRVEIIFHSESLTRQLRLLSDRVAAGKGRHIAAGLIDAARAYMAYIRARFMRASRHDGTWKDHATSTKERKLAKHTPTLKDKRRGAFAQSKRDPSGLQFAILFDTGRLFQSLSPGGPGYVERFVNPLTIAVGTSVIYAAPHQFGVPRRNLPQRTILDVPDVRTVRVMEKIIADAVEREAKEAEQTVGV